MSDEDLARVSVRVTAERHGKHMHPRIAKLARVSVRVTAERHGKLPPAYLHVKIEFTSSNSTLNVCLRQNSAS